MFEPDREGDVESFDGTRLRYQVFGEGPPLVIGNGIGVGFRGLRLQIEHLRRRFRVVTWDHRGIFASAPPGPAGVRIAAHAEDCLALMDALGIAEAAYVGWSMGVQVGLEAARRGRFTHLALIAGVAGRPARAALPLPIDGLAARVLRGASPLAPAPLWGVVGHEAFFGLARAVGFVRPSADRELFMGMVRGVASHDPEVYLSTLAALLEHDAAPVLRGLDRPVLFLAGEKDRLTPPRILDRLARLAKKGRAQTIPDGSHFALIEHPAAVNRALDDFLGTT